MLTKEDKSWIISNFVTKGELQVGFHEVKEAVSRVEELSKKTLSIVEGLAGKVADLDQENKMGSITLRRHDAQIHELAKATGTKISD